MNPANKLRSLPILRWVSSHLRPNPLQSPVLRNPRFYSPKAASSVSVEDRTFDGASSSKGMKKVRIPKAVIREAQDALFDYLHGTRSLQFLDADFMSKNSPIFLEKLLPKAGNNPESTKSTLTKYLRYNPINEFEPFLESMGLDASEFIPLLPRDWMYLSDDPNLLENYHVLCNYGIPREKIGKVYREARAVFGYGHGVLDSKWRAYQGLGLSESTLVKFVICSPSLLVGDLNEEFTQVLGKMRGLGFQISWLEEHLVEDNSYHWGRILELVRVLHDLGCDEAELAGLLRRHPDLVFDASACVTFSLIGFLFKVGAAEDGVYSLLTQFPQLQVGKVLKNLRNVLNFLVEIDMEAEEVGKILCSHTVVLASCSLKKCGSVINPMGVGKKRMCDIIKDDPLQLKNWVIGAKIKKWISEEEKGRSLKEKIKFLCSIGYTEGTPEMEKALKLFRGTGLEIQERFDYLVSLGFDRQDVVKMMGVAPQVLNLTVKSLQAKADYLVNTLGYPITSIVSFPSYFSYNKARVWLRMTMYSWLVERGIATPNLRLSTVLSCTEEIFMASYVSKHPRGPVVWKRMKAKASSMRD